MIAGTPSGCHSNRNFLSLSRARAFFYLVPEAASNEDYACYSLEPLWLVVEAQPNCALFVCVGVGGFFRQFCR